MMNLLKAPSLQSLLESDRGSNDSLLAESLQLDFDEVVIHSSSTVFNRNLKKNIPNFFQFH